MKTYYAINLDDCVEEMFEKFQKANEGGAGHFITGKSKESLANAMSKVLNEWVIENCYESDDYGYEKDTPND